MSLVSYSTLTLAQAGVGAFQGRIRAATATSLRLEPYGATGLVEVAGDIYSLALLPTGDLRLAPTDNLLDANGGDAGAAMVASTLYYIYVGSRAAPTFAGTLRASLTAPTKVGGVYYLGAASNAPFWRFVGMVFTTAATQFSDNGGAGSQLAATRWVCNYYNRLRTAAVCRPNYLDQGADNFYTNAALGVWGPINGGVDDFVSFLHNGEDCYEATAVYSVHVLPDQDIGVAIGDTSTTTPLRAAAIGGRTGYIVNAVGPVVLAAVGSMPTTVRLSTVSGTMGLRTLNMLVFNQAQNVEFWADIRRHGATFDVPATYLDATLML